MHNLYTIYNLYNIIWSEPVSCEMIERNPRRSYFDPSINLDMSKYFLVLMGDKLVKCCEWQLLVFTCYIQKYYTDWLRIIQALLNESFAPGLCLRPVLWSAGRTENTAFLWRNMFANNPLGIKCLQLGLFT